MLALSFFRIGADAPTLTLAFNSITWRQHITGVSSLAMAAITVKDDYSRFVPAGRRFYPPFALTVLRGVGTVSA